MTGRERLMAICHKQPADRLAWTILVDDATVSHLPVNLQGRHGMDFCQHLGCDVFLLNGWNTPITFASPRLDWGPGVEEYSRTEGNLRIQELVTPYGTLTMQTEHDHPVRHWVTSVDEVRLFQRVWEQAKFVVADDAVPHQRLTDLIGNQGIYTRYWGPSTIPRLLEYDIGMEAFYYLKNDYPDEMKSLIETMHAKEMDAFRSLACASAEVITLTENTSTYYISPELYREYNGAHVRDYVQTIKAAGKVALVHMCGHVRQLLDQIKLTGLDGAHALTPPHTGDTPWELALDVLGEDTIIIGALPPDLWAAGPIENIAAALDQIYTPRLRRSHFVLCLFADGITVPQERFEAVARWMEKQG